MNEKERELRNTFLILYGAACLACAVMVGYGKGIIDGRGESKTQTRVIFVPEPPADDETE